MCNGGGVIALQGVYPHSWGCAYQEDMCTGGGVSTTGGNTFIAGGVHTRTYVYWGRGINYRGCTFIAGGVHTSMHVYWGRGINDRRCTFIAGGVHTMTHILPQLVKSIYDPSVPMGRHVNTNGNIYLIKSL